MHYSNAECTIPVLFQSIMHYSNAESKIPRQCATRVIYKLKYLLFRCRKLTLPMQKVIHICFVEGRIIHRVCWALCLPKWDRSTLNKSLRCSTGTSITGVYGFPMINLVHHRGIQAPQAKIFGILDILVHLRCVLCLCVFLCGACVR